MRISDWSSDVCSSDLTDAQADPWVAGQRTQVTHDGRRPEGATDLRKARREVGHLDDAILVVVEAGYQHGGIAAIGLLGALEILELDIVEAALCIDRKCPRLNSSHSCAPRLPSSD